MRPEKLIDHVIIDGLFAMHYGKAFQPHPRPHLPPTTYPQSLPPASFPTFFIVNLVPRVSHLTAWSELQAVR